jgi:hypothetical protein
VVSNLPRDVVSNRDTARHAGEMSADTPFFEPAQARVTKGLLLNAKSRPSGTSLSQRTAAHAFGIEADDLPAGQTGARRHFGSIFHFGDLPPDARKIGLAFWLSWGRSREVRLAVISGWDALLLLQRKATDARAINESLGEADAETRCREGGRCRSLHSPRPQFQ